jgi:hypothetical protein
LENTVVDVDGIVDSDPDDTAVAAQNHMDAAAAAAARIFLVVGLVVVLVYFSVFVVLCFFVAQGQCWRLSFDLLDILP